MDERGLQSHVRDAYGIRLRPEMSRFVLKAIQAGENAAGSVAVIGGDARTGRPMRADLPIAKLVGAPADK